MHRVIAGCNLWALLFLAAALLLGATRSPYHVKAGIFAAVFALLAQSAIFAMFMGASKLLKEHIERFAVPRTLMDRTNQIMIPLFRWAFGACAILLLFAITAGLSVSGEVPPIVHVVLGIAAMAVVVLAVTREVPALAQMHEVLRAMEANLPEDAAARAAAAAAVAVADPEGPDLRARALVYVGSTLLAAVFGYRFIAGWPLPLWFLAVSFVIGSLCLAAAGARRLQRRT